MNPSAIEKDPFRVFFPLGVILGMTGVIPWIAVFWNQASYPVAFHKAIMMNGFLLTFVVGFLMTAIPRFTSTAFARMREVAFPWLCLLGSGLAALAGLDGLHYLLASCALMGLMTFAIRRFLSRRSNPPPTFVFVGTGLGFWLLTNLTLAATGFGLLSFGPIESIAREIFSHGAVLGLIIGIGSRLIPGIFGWTEIVSQPKGTDKIEKPYAQVIPRDVWIALLIFWGSYLMAPLLPHAVKLGVRSLVVIYFAVCYWHIHRFPRNRSYLTSGIWLSALCLVLGSVLQWVWPAGAIHALHVALIGGFSLLTIMIASRVTLAHGAEGTAAETSMRSLHFLACAFLLAMVIRVAAILVPTLYLQLLGGAALVFILGLAGWMAIFLKRLLAPLRASAPNQGPPAKAEHPLPT